MGSEGSDKEIPVTPNNPESRNTANLLLRDDFDGAINGKMWDLKRIKADRWTLTEMAGRKALGITLEKGDKQEVSSMGILTERSEFSERKTILVPADIPVWYGFSFYFPPNFPIVENRLVFAQWKQQTETDESPFLSFRYVGGKLIFQINYGDQKVKFEKMTDLRGEWHDVLVNYGLGKENSGFAKAWVDGFPLAEYEGKMGHERDWKFTYFKMGLYRDRLETPQTIYLARFRRGPNKEACLT